jgi:two-component system, NarL family, nitrate/nitrite response regulator NarL
MRNLTPLLEETLKLFAIGLSNDEIAQHYGVSPHTIGTRRKNILAVLGAKSLPHAVALYLGAAPYWEQELDL